MLKKYFTIIIFIFCFGFISVGQQFHGGVIAGLAGTQVAGDTYSGYNKAGIFAGGYVSIDVGEKSAFQMELSYFQKGSRENPKEKNGYKFYLLRLNYIELPVLYQFKAGKFIIETGPSAGILMGYYEESFYEVISDNPANKPASITFQINLGFRYFISQHYGVSLRTNNSLMNVFSRNQDGDVWRFWDHGRYNDALVLSVFYQFR
ncbi:MAG: PorT family protein [Bacteroidetes bacterium]|nr:PorT family protein [Bacteroidota bacterium]MBL6943199.1 PorT family protein [Bacteroidales bacterium]